MKLRQTLCLLFVLVFVVCLCSGCVKSDTHMTIHKDRSMDFSATYLVEDSFADMTSDEQGAAALQVNPSSDNWKNLTDRGYTVKEVKKDGYTGFQATCHFPSIDTLASDKGVGVVLNNYLNKDFDDSKFFTVRRKLFEDTYTAHFVYDFSDNNTTSPGGADDTDMSVYTSAIEVTYRVTLPCLATAHNATSVSEDGLTYTWKIPYGSLTAIDYSFTMQSRNVLYFIIGGVVLVLLIAAAVVFFLLRKRKKTAPAENADLPAPKNAEEAAALLATMGLPSPEPESEPEAKPEAESTPTAPPAPAPQPAPKPADPTVCPLCGGKLTVRVAKSGAHIGAKYAVCEHYPATCKYAKPLQ